MAFFNHARRRHRGEIFVDILQIYVSREICICCPMLLSRGNKKKPKRYVRMKSLSLHVYFRGANRRAGGIVQHLFLILRWQAHNGDRV